jgi:hypothetical protein
MVVETNEHLNLHKISEFNTIEAKEKKKLVTNYRAVIGLLNFVFNLPRSVDLSGVCNYLFLSLLYIFIRIVIFKIYFNYIFFLSLLLSLLE